MMKAPALALFLSIACLLPLNARAQTQAVPPATVPQAAAPGMMNVKEIIIQYPRFASQKRSDSCGLSREELVNDIDQALKLETLTAIKSSNAGRPNQAVARLDLVPEISTLTTPTGDCISWVALIAQTQGIFALPPLTTPRNALVVFWRSGQIASSGPTSHLRIVGDILEKLAQAFAREYFLEQPPPLPNFSEQEKSIH